MRSAARARTRRLTARLVAAGVLLSLGGLLAVFAQDEGELLRQIKSDVFDQKWESVLASCDRLIDRYPRSPAAPRAYYYRAQALEHVKGREADALQAYADFLIRFPAETGALKEDAVLSRITLASTLYQRGDRRHVGVIIQGMDGRGYVRSYAAIQASKIDHKPARAKALPILKECVERESDPELRNECLLGVLRIDPQATPGLRPHIPTPTPPTPPGGLRPPARPPAPGEVRMIRLEVFDKAKNQATVRVNMPIAFAEIFLQTVGDNLRDEIQKHMDLKGMDLDQFWKAIKDGGPQTLVEIDDGDQKIKVWIE